MNFIPYLNCIKNIIKQIIKIVSKIRGGMKMKFVKGVMLGTIVTAGVAMMYMDSNQNLKKKMKKEGKKILKNIGM